jgi:methylthioribose-1-phosphate isomerase
MKPLEWLGDRIRILDQTELPLAEKYLELTDYREVISAIKELRVRGAPAIGITAAYGIYLGALSLHGADTGTFREGLESVFDAFAAARPTAVNLFHAINIMRKAATPLKNISGIKTELLQTAVAFNREEALSMAKLSKSGAVLLADGCTVLTHCNTGQLATGVQYGTALGVIKAATEQGKSIGVYADETRPLLQGARLTTWELKALNIPVTLITDSMAGFYMSKHVIDCVIVGADRIALNGDTANKIGTYSIAVLAKENHIPFYIAAPVSSIDFTIKSGSEIIIEERDEKEILRLRGIQIAPPGIRAANPAFDITPAKYINAIITDKGIVKPPFRRSLLKLREEEK